MRFVWFVLAILLAIYLLANAKAHAHDWYTNEKNPVTSGNCCGGDDCSIIPDHFVTPVPGGYHVKIFFKGKNVDEVVGNDVARPAKDEINNYHLCVNPYTNKIQCFFFPAPTY